ncbi:hypothetical protein BCR33DRAFT_712524 [Rhizoclosmatium globosum]|uniref:MARVEL domain-containing protein n=1 Tax=Rhizoclosmatium globosum TaxID=329046 RepID=A0A1Y2CWS4_9FUNG|nr:hypothetical protein BCR33DRAFT_712524 [Rhizoclosmatium globosum]|eukprot:ORY51478.1 hypothetical protein BCR33DRAFT_712524 [Rhizoclosmatium globosum]
MSSKIKVLETPEARGNKAEAGKKPGIRSSIDLELQLGFERNPLDKPSSDFRDADSWFSKAKQTAETTAEPARPENASRKSFGLFGASRSSRYETNDQQHQQQSNDAAQEAGGRRSIFRNSLFGGGDQPSLPPRATNKRPMGPRALDGQPQQDFQLRSVGTVKGADSGQGWDDSDPADLLSAPHYLYQMRMWVNALLLLAAILAASVMGGLAGVPAAPSQLSSRFWIFTSVLSIVVAVFQIVYFHYWGHKLMYHYDAPFLLLSSTGLGTGSGSTRNLNRSDLYLPGFDFILHVLLLIFWIGTLSDVGTGIGSCRSVSLSLNTSTGVCTGFEAAVAFGVIAIVGVIFTTGMKAWELYQNLAMIKRAL